MAHNTRQPRLSRATAAKAAGYDAVCLFVNDNASAEIIDILADNGVKFIAMRCAGFDRVDIDHAAKRGIRIARVPTYSPASVAEHALALILTLSRYSVGYIVCCLRILFLCVLCRYSIHRIAHNHRKLQLAIPRCRDGNYTVSGLQGWELASRNFGIVGTGAIGAVMARLCLVRRLCQHAAALLSTSVMKIVMMIRCCVFHSFERP